MVGTTDSPSSVHRTELLPAAWTALRTATRALEGRPARRTTQARCPSSSTPGASSQGDPSVPATADPCHDLAARDAASRWERNGERRPVAGTAAEATRPAPSPPGPGPGYQGGVRHRCRPAARRQRAASPPRDLPPQRPRSRPVQAGTLGSRAAARLAAAPTAQAPAPALLTLRRSGSPRGRA